MSDTTTFDAPRSEDRLLDLVADAARGPRRDGLFALWLVVRVVRDLALEPPLPDRLQRRRIAALGQRLSSLAVPAPLRRALASSLSLLEEPATADPAVVLSQLVAPARETTNPEAAELLSQLARRARG